MRTSSSPSRLWKMTATPAVFLGTSRAGSSFVRLRERESMKLVFGRLKRISENIKIRFAYLSKNIVRF
jgi:hypothetical protein